MLIAVAQASAGAQGATLDRSGLDSLGREMQNRTLSAWRYSVLLGVAQREVSTDSLRALVARALPMRGASIPASVPGTVAAAPELTCPMPIAQARADVSRPMPTALIDSEGVADPVATIRACTNPLAVR